MACNPAGIEVAEPSSAQPERSEGNPAVWGLSKRVRQPRSTQPYGPHFPQEETRKLAQPERSESNPALSAVLGLRVVHITSSAHYPTSLNKPQNIKPEPARGEFRF